MNEKAILLFGLWSCLAVTAGCVEPGPSEVANSDQGYLFVDLEEPIAAGWESQVLILGPTTGSQHCDAALGCYADHRRLEMKEVRSANEDIVEVLAFEEEKIGEVWALRLHLQAHEEGEVTLEFVFGIDGLTPGEGEVSVDEEGNFVDSFGVETREVAYLRLERLVEGIDAFGPYGQCPESGVGTYLMNVPGAYDVHVRFLKLDERGNRLRGSGQFPFVAEPEDVVEVEEADESLHLVRFKPQRFGAVSLTPEEGGEAFTTRFTAINEVQAVEVRAFELGTQGNRGREVTTFQQGLNYELLVTPVSPEAPLCGGNLEFYVQSLAPAICEPLGSIQGRAGMAVAVHHAGECFLRISAPAARGGQGVIRDLVVDVGQGY